MWCVSLDHGFKNPTAVLWHAVGSDGQVITFKEHYVSGLTIDAHAKRIHEINKELGRPPDYYIGDPSIRNTDPITGTSIHEEYIKFGIPLTLANNDVAAGLVRVSRYLKVTGEGKPTWCVTENCEMLIWEMLRYRWKTYANKRLDRTNNAQEGPNKKDDHACDSLRYFIMSRPDLGAGFGEHNAYESRNPYGSPEVRTEGFVVADPNYSPNPVGDYGNVWELDEQMGGEW
jgi:hypothetical protein